MDRIDFRSDTVSWPTPAMREAMARARVGDDVYGEDPTVNELEALAAARVGKEAGLFVASGTMGNLAAVLAHAGRGDEAILGEDSHVFCWEAGGMAALGGVMPHPLPTDAIGRMAPGAVEDAIRWDDPHVARSRLVLLENSYGGKHGYPLPPEYLASIAAVARQYGLALHLDGARLFNAAVAQNIDAAELDVYKRQVYIPNATLAAEVTALAATEGRLWLGIKTGRVAVEPVGDSCRFAAVEPSAWVNDALRDRQGDVWLAVDGEGVLRLGDGRCV